MASEAASIKKRRSAPRKKSVFSALPKVNRHGESWFDEILSVIFFVLAVFLLVSFLSYKLSTPDSLLTPWSSDMRPSEDNLMGPVGHLTGTLLSGFLGWCTFVAILWAAWFSIYFWNYEKHKSDAKGRSNASLWLVLVGFAGMLIFSCSLVSILGGYRAGGSLGDAIAAPLLRLFGSIGGGSLCLLAFLVSVALATRTTIAFTALSFGVALGRVFHLFAVRIPQVLFGFVSSGFALLFAGVKGFYQAFALGRETRDELEEILPKPRRRRNEIAPLIERQPEETVRSVSLPQPPAAPPEKLFNVIVSRRSEIGGSKHKRVKLREDSDALERLGEVYQPPTLDLLTRAETSGEAESDEELRQKSQLIESKLRDFNIEGRVTHVHPGPVITLFEFEPAPGVKVGRIAALQDDLAMGLRSTSIRIVAPIPRRGTVGIEVPNRHRDMVRLRDLLEAENFQNAESVLTVPLGKDTSGDPVVADIATMPHLLMAGATGTGKSVCINSILISLLYRASPKDLGLILIDPKILELSVYADIPHLRVPVVVDPRQAKAVLQWAVNEMNRRYRMMQRFGVRSIDGYNRVVSGETSPDTLRERDEQEVIRLSENEVIEDGIEGSPEGKAEGEADLPVEQLRPLPKIMIVIDELADLMFSSGRDIEELITRLAQKARASGIHLIVATQRPSVDVITGLIKANFPARLSFRVSSRIDSRTILDTGGAEKLLGRGDILLQQPGAEALKRIHGAYVSDSEVKRVVDAAKRSGKPQYDPHIMQLCEKALEENEEGSASSESNGELEYDPLYDKAVELVVEKGQASTSMIQRVFRIGYNRAARMIEVMEKEGVIGPMDGVKPREVLLPHSPADEGLA